MSDDSILNDSGWELYGLFREAYLAVTRAIEADIDTPELRDEVQDLMLRLARTPDHALRPGQLTRDTGTTPSSMTRLLDEAEALGIIERTPDPTDRRATLIRLTDHGTQRTLAWATTGLEATKRHFNMHLSHREAEDLEIIFRRLREVTRDHHPRPEAPTGELSTPAHDSASEDRQSNGADDTGSRPER